MLQVHSTLDGSDAADFTFTVKFNSRDHSVAVRQRPFLAAFLERVAQLFEVVVFTASQKVYAEQLLNILDPKRYTGICQQLHAVTFSLMPVCFSPPMHTWNEKHQTRRHKCNQKSQTC